MRNDRDAGAASGFWRREKKEKSPNNDAWFDFHNLSAHSPAVEPRQNPGPMRDHSQDCGGLVSGFCLARKASSRNFRFCRCCGLATARDCKRARLTAAAAVDITLAGAAAAQQSAFPTMTDALRCRGAGTGPTGSFDSRSAVARHRSVPRERAVEKCAEDGDDHAAGALGFRRGYVWEQRGKRSATNWKRR